MKTPSKNLFQLIHSLTQSEKRYISLYGGMYGKEKNHLKLFDFLLHQKAYTEDLVKKELNLHQNNQYPVLKGYLQDLILKAMRAFHASSTEYERFANLIKDAKFYFQKRMHVQALAILDKLEPELEKQEYWNLLDECYKLKTNVFTLNYFEGVDIKKMNSFLQKMDWCSRQEENYKLYYQYSLETIFLVNFSKSKGKKNTSSKRIEAIAKTDYITDFSKCTTAKSKHFFYQTNTAIAHYFNDFKKEINYSKLHLEFLLNNPDLFDLRYVLIVNNALYAALIKDLQYDKAYKSLLWAKDKVKSEKNLDENSIQKSLFNLYATEIDFILLKTEKIRLSHFVQELKEFYEKNHAWLGNRSFYFVWLKIIFAFYILGNMKEAMAWVFKMQKNLDKKLDIEFYKQALAVQILISFQESEKNKINRKTKLLKSLCREEVKEDELYVQMIQTIHNLQKKIAQPTRMIRKYLEKRTDKNFNVLERLLHVWLEKNQKATS